MDIDAQLDAVDRGIATGTREGADTYVQTVAQTYPAPIDDVWDALTSAERLPRWFLPVSGDLRLGGRYAIEGNASGTVESCDAPELLRRDLGVRRRRHLGHRAPRRCRARGAPASSSSTSPRAPTSAPRCGSSSARPRRASAGTRPCSGSRSTSRRGEVKPENAQEWLAGEEGIGFMRGSADRWAAAHVAMGADPDVARAAADTTFAAYTGAAPAQMD